jgi:hypothetical protein
MCCDNSVSVATLLLFSSFQYFVFLLIFFLFVSCSVFCLLLHLLLFSSSSFGLMFTVITFFFSSDASVLFFLFFFVFLLHFHLHCRLARFFFLKFLVSVTKVRPLPLFADMSYFLFDAYHRADGQINKDRDEGIPVSNSEVCRDCHSLAC